jgi:hypothetical protein
MALFRRRAGTTEPEPAPPAPNAPGVKKARPTPTRKEAEAARRHRVHRNLTPKQARAERARQARAERMRAMSARDRTPEKTLMRDYIDARFNLGEFLLPSVVVLLALTVFGAYWPQASIIVTLMMYAFLLSVILDGAIMWRGFKRMLEERLPGTSTKGLVFYGITRSTQIRRFRMPPVRVKRGEKI